MEESQLRRLNYLMESINELLDEEEQIDWYDLLDAADDIEAAIKELEEELERLQSK